MNFVGVNRNAGQMASQRSGANNQGQASLEVPEGQGIDRPDTISSLEQTTTRSQPWCLAGRPGTEHDPSVFQISRTMDQESLSYWRRFTAAVRLELLKR